jgi:hypothetical protein
MLSASQSAAELPQALGELGEFMSEKVSAVGEGLAKFGAVAIAGAAGLVVFTGGLAIAEAGVVAAFGAVAVAAGLAILGLGKLGELFGGLFKTLSAAMRAMDEQVERYGQYDPRIAYAEAQAEIVQTLGDLRRSREVAPDLVRFIEARTRLQQQFEDAKIHFIHQITPALLSGMDAAANILQRMETFKVMFIAWVEAEGQHLYLIGGLLKSIKEFLETKAAETDPVNLDILNEILLPWAPPQGLGGQRAT